MKNINQTYKVLGISAAICQTPVKVPCPAVFLSIFCEGREKPPNGLRQDRLRFVRLRGELEASVLSGPANLNDKFPLLLA